MLKFDHLYNSNPQYPDLADVMLRSDSKIEFIKNIYAQSVTEGDLTCRIFVDQYSDNVVRYGAEQISSFHYGHKRGYIWSSRASFINKVFGTKYAEVVIDNVGRYAIDIDDLKEILPGEYEIKVTENDGEKTYYVARK